MREEMRRIRNSVERKQSREQKRSLKRKRSLDRKRNIESDGNEIRGSLKKKKSDSTVISTRPCIEVIDVEDDTPPPEDELTQKSYGLRKKKRW